MDRIFSLGSGLEMFVVNHIDFERGLGIVSIIEECESLQRVVFQEHGVSFPDKRVLLAKDSVGTLKSPGSLDGTSPTYHHLYLMHGDKVVGMRVTEELEVKGLGRIVLDYLPPLVPTEYAERVYKFRVSGKPQFGIGLGGEMTPLQILTAFAEHLERPGEVLATFTDGIGVSRQHLRDNGHLRSEVSIWVPPMDATTREGYLTVLPEPVHMFARFAKNARTSIPKAAAEWLFVQKYLKDGYLDRGKLRQLGLKINELPCVVNSREAIFEAVGKRGYVAFWPIN